MTTSDLMKQYFNNILQRSPTTSELGYWSMIIDTGALTKLQAVQALASGSEAMNYGAQIIRIYQAAFGRVPDTVGMKGWTTMLREDPSALFKIAGGFVNSLEWKTRYGDSSVSDTVLQALYVNVLGRSASQKEITDWKATGQSMGQILVGFSNSEEFTLNSQKGVIKLLEAAGGVSSDSLSTVFDGKSKLLVVHGTKWPMLDHAADAMDSGDGTNDATDTPAAASPDAEQGPAPVSKDASSLAAVVAAHTNPEPAGVIDFEGVLRAAASRDPVMVAEDALRGGTAWHPAAETIPLIGIADPA